MATQLSKIQKMEILLLLEKQCNPPGTGLSLLNNEVQSGDQLRLLSNPRFDKSKIHNWDKYTWKEATNCGCK